MNRPKCLPLSQKNIQILNLNGQVMRQPAKNCGKPAMMPIMPLWPMPRARSGFQQMYVCRFRVWPNVWKKPARILQNAALFPALLAMSGMAISTVCRCVTPKIRKCARLLTDLSAVYLNGRLRWAVPVQASMASGRASKIISVKSMVMRWM